MDDEELAFYEVKARLAESRDCQVFKEILLDMVFDYSKGNLDPAELKGMVRLLANTRDWDKEFEKKLRQAKEKM